MKEEEVDQYFKDKFKQFTPPPPADAWARLQHKMEPPPQKRPVMWLYYAAAVVTLLIASGVLLFWINNGQSRERNNLARLEPITTPLRVNPSPAASIAAEEVKAPAALPTIEIPTAEKDIKSTSGSTTTTSKPVKKGKKIRPGILVAATKPNLLQPEPKNASTPQPQPDQSSVELASTAPVTNNSAMAGEEVMEVVIKKDPVTTVAAANGSDNQTAEQVIKENISKKGRLVKNVFKQARNLKNGDKVELSTLGLNANYRIDVESKLFKQKYTKVINL